VSALYRYELRRGDEVVATGHLSLDQPLEIGEPIAIGEWRGIVRSIEPLLGDAEQRLVVQLRSDCGGIAIRVWRGSPPDRATRSRRE
jgi:hypothetical protein